MQKQSVNSFTLDEEYLLQNKDNSSQQTAISSINMFTVWYVLSMQFPGKSFWLGLRVGDDNEYVFCDRTYAKNYSQIYNRMRTSSMNTCVTAALLVGKRKLPETSTQLL